MDSTSYTKVPAPAWLGVVAAISFAGLVVAAFVSGYYLVSAPPAASARATGGGGLWGPGQEAVVRQTAGSAAADVRAEPGAGTSVERLVAGERVGVLEQRGAWLRIRYEREGKPREGWIEGAILLPVAAADAR